MVERLCPRCRVDNPIEAQRCNACNALLQEQLPAVHRSNPLAPARRLPRSLSRAAQPIALGLAALAIEIGAALLQRRQAAADRRPGHLPSQARRRVAQMTVGQRVWEEYAQDGKLRRRTIEQFIIRGEE